MCLRNLAAKTAHVLGIAHLVELCQLASLICLGINNSTLAFSNLTLSQLACNHLLTFFWNSVWPLLALSLAGGMVTRDIIYVATLMISFEHFSLCLSHMCKPERPTAPNIQIPIKRKSRTIHHHHPKLRFAHIEHPEKHLTSRTLMLIKLKRLKPLVSRSKPIKLSKRARKQKLKEMKQKQKEGKTQ